VVYDCSGVHSIFSPITNRPPDPQLLGFLEAYDRHIAELALALREIILEEAPDASESVYQVYTVAIWFGFSGKMKDMFCYSGSTASRAVVPMRRLQHSGRAVLSGRALRSSCGDTKEARTTPPEASRRDRP
jgi:hypothetical protein